MNKIHKIVIGGLCIVAIAIVGYYLIQQIKKSYIKKETVESINSSLQQMQELKKLGFADTDSRMIIIKQYITEAEQKIKAIDSTWSVTSLLQEQQAERKEKLDRLVEVTKKLVENYKKELENLRKTSFATS